MNCKNAQALLSAYLDEELSGREMLDIREHLHQCEACAEEVRCVQAVKRILSAAPVPEPSADFENRLVSRVLQAVPATAQPKRLSVVALTGIAAASMLATMLLLNTMHRESPVVDPHDSIATDLLRRDRMYDVSSDPFSGTPVVWKGQ